MNEPTSALLEELIGLERQTPRELGLSIDEAALIDRCLSGDDTAFDQVVERYQDMVYNLAYRLLGGDEEAFDLSQEVFLQVYRKLDTFRQDASLRTWIYRIVINRAKNRQRWWRRRLAEMTALTLEEVERVPNGQLSIGLNGKGVSPDEALQRKELGDILDEAIERLPFEQRTALVLRDIEGLSYEEIAETLSLPVGTVKSRIARARGTLREKLDPELLGLTGEY